MSFWREIIFPGSTIEDDTRQTWAWDKDTIIRAQGLYSFFEKFANIVILITLRNVLDFVKPLSIKLQKTDIDIFQAHTMVDDVLQSLNDLRAQIGIVFIDWWQQINDLANSDPEIPRLASRQIHRANVSTVCNPEWCLCQDERCCKSYYIRAIVLPLIDHLRSDLETRFADRISLVFF